MLACPELAVFAAVTNEPELPQGLEDCEVSFRVWIHKSAFNLGRWPKVGKMPIGPELSVSVDRFSQDALDPTKFSLWNGDRNWSVSREECEGLECAAVWDPNHVEDRIRDLADGVPNKWLESMRPTPAA